jgi:LysM repeat protein
MKIFRICLLLAVFLAFAVPSGGAQANAGMAYDLIAEVNALRQTQGLSALEANGALMAAAQGQSDHLAATYGTSPPTWDMGHVGAGGTNVRERAVAAGYPLGAGGNVLENWAAARTGTSASTIVYSMWSDASHWNQMLNADAVDVGAGVSESGGMVYFILNIGVKYGSGGGTSAGTGVASTIPTAAVTARVAPVSVTAPDEDGAIIHVVQIGQALWSIATAYDVSVDQLIALNNLSANAVIYEGQELLIQVGHTPTVTPTITLTPRPATRTPVPQQTAQELEEEEEVDAPSILSMDRRSMGIALVLVCGIGLALIVVGTASKERGKKKTPRDDSSERPPDDLF